MDEKQAITHLKRGDIDALDVLVNLYQLKAVRAACLIVYDRSLAEDIVQSAFIRAYERIVQFDDQRPFGPWFLRSVVNDTLKAANRQKKLVSLEEDDYEIHTGSMTEDPSICLLTREDIIAIAQNLR
jgi:RNA polymerase sigma-70 factor (ECF subfamily)